MPIRNRQARMGEEVRHDATGANGIVIKGGFGPRVQWLTNGRTTRVGVGDISEGHRPSKERGGSATALREEARYQLATFATGRDGREVDTDWEDLLAEVGRMRRQIDAAHGFLDLRDAPRKPVDGQGELTLAGRIEEMTGPGGPWVRLDAVLRYVRARPEDRESGHGLALVDVDDMAREFGAAAQEEDA